MQLLLFHRMTFQIANFLFSSLSEKKKKKKKKTKKKKNKKKKKKKKKNQNKQNRNEKQYTCNIYKKIHDVKISLAPITNANYW